MSLKKDFIKVAGSNVLLLVASTLNNFVLPIILSISGYANYKTYLLYASFSGFFHLGYIDGINLKYGGQCVKGVDKNTFWGEHHFFLLFQVFITLILLAIAFFTKSLLFGLFAISILPMNMQSFFLFFLQAIGQFSIYAKCVIVVPLLMSTATCAAFIAHFDAGYLFFCVTHLSCYLCSWFLLEFFTIKKVPFSPKLSFGFLKDDHKGLFMSGFFIMMGTIVFSLFTTAGRWMIKWQMNDISFAIYSMAASLMGFVMIFVNSINKVFYPYLCRNAGDKKRNKVLVDSLLIITTISLSFFYPLKFLVIQFLPKYVESIELVRILLMTLPFIVIIQSYYINIYKTNKMERRYLLDALLYTFLAFVVNFITVSFIRDLRAVAIAAVICTSIWYFFPNKTIYEHHNCFKNLAYFLIVFCIYLGAEFIFSSIWGAFVVSLCGLLLVNFLFYREDFCKLLSE